MTSKQGTLHTGDDHVDGQDQRLLYWAVNFLDHIICFATGRPLTTRREDIDVQPPSNLTVCHDGQHLPSPFPAMIRVIQVQGLVYEVIGKLSENSVDIPPETRRQLLAHGDDLMAYYTSLHPLLTFDVPNFRAHASAGQGGTFLLLHLWFNSVSFMAVMLGSACWVLHHMLTRIIDHDIFASTRPQIWPRQSSR